jgi:hypothetical protein
MAPWPSAADRVLPDPLFNRESRAFAVHLLMSRPASASTDSAPLPAPPALIGVKHRFRGETILG